MPKTFAQYMIEKTLPEGIHVTKPMTKSYMTEILTQVFRDHENDYGRVVTDLKTLGDKFSTLDGNMSMGMEEITLSKEKKALRDALVTKYQGKVRTLPRGDLLDAELMKFQTELAKLDITGNETDDATRMITSGAMGGKRIQLMKLRTGPGVVKSSNGAIHPEVITKSYAEGLDPAHYWLGAVESRTNLAQGQVSTSEPGELGKVISNVLNSAVVSTEDCGTTNGIALDTEHDSVVGRHLARSEGKYPRNTLVTPQIQQSLISAGVHSILVRSPQTCHAPKGSVCVMCMGLKPSNGRHYAIGENAGLITAGMLAEPLTQMSLSAKHSTSFAKKDSGLTGTKGFRKFVEAPQIYKGAKVLCEVYGKVYRIVIAPQGGHYIEIDMLGRKVPERFIQNGTVDSKMKTRIRYYVPPQLHIHEDLKAGSPVFPAMEMSDGIDNMRDIARLQGLGVVRSKSAEGMHSIYKNTGTNMDRRHFELLARNAHSYVKVEKSSPAMPFHRGEVISYEDFNKALAHVASREFSLDMADGVTLTEGIGHFTVGTEVTPEVVSALKSLGVKKVKGTTDVEVSPAITPMSRVVNRSNDFIAAMNHRYLKDQIEDAAAIGKKSDIHGFNPITAYAHGTEFHHGEKGEY